MAPYQTRVLEKPGADESVHGSDWQSLIPRSRLGTGPSVPGFSAFLDFSVFVKLAYLVIASGALAFFLIRMREGGSLAAAAETASAGLEFAIGALIVVFGVLVVGSSFRNKL